MTAPDFTSHPGEPFGRWCYRKDPKCGEPDLLGVATFCGQACWREAGSPNLVADGLKLDADGVR